MDNIFCKNLKSARIKAGMTQEQIASAVGADACVIFRDILCHKIKNSPRQLITAEGFLFKKTTQNVK